MKHDAVTTRPRRLSDLPLWRLLVALGPPAYGSSWYCPFCDPDGGGGLSQRGGKPESKWASFSVRPPFRKYAIKFKCHRCQTWGDEHDLLRKFCDDPEERQWWIDYAMAYYPPELRSPRGYPDSSNTANPVMMPTNTQRGDKRRGSPNGAHGAIDYEAAKRFFQQRRERRQKEQREERAGQERNGKRK